MISAQEAKKITNSSSEKFKQEVSRIEDLVIQAAESGLTKIITTAPIEIANRIREEFTLNGYAVNNEQGTGINISW